MAKQEILISSNNTHRHARALHSALTSQLRSGPKSTTSDQRSRHPHDSPRRGESSVSHTKTLMERASSRNQLSPLPKIGEGFGEWSEAPSYEEGVGVDGNQQGAPCIIAAPL